MTPEEKLRFDELESKVNRIYAIFNSENFRDKFATPRSVIVRDSNGTNFVEIDVVNKKIGFYGVTAVSQASGQSYPSGGATVDSQARTAINNIIDTLHNIGITL